jgi:type IX secretion system PorP/SprF family membrane protein
MTGNNRYMTYRLLGLLMLVLVTLGLRAQQEPYATHYMYNLMAVNPGYAGASDGINITGISHNQWQGFVGVIGMDSTYNLAPRTNYISVDAPISFLRGGLGGSIIQDNLGGYQNLGINFGYAFRTGLFGGEIGIGPQVSLWSRTFDPSSLQTVVEEQFPAGEQSDMIFDMNFGAYFEMPGQYYIGLSATNLLESQGKNTSYSNRRHYMLNAGYQYILPNKPEFELEPSVMLVYDGAALQYFFGSMVKYKNQFFGGLTYSLTNDLGAHVGFYYKDFKVGYAYGLTTSRIIRYSGGTHEIYLNYNFKIDIDKINNRYKNTRFL